MNKTVSFLCKKRKENMPKMFNYSNRKGCITLPCNITLMIKLEFRL